MEPWRHVKQRASDALIAGGGTITHHHAVGRDHMPWYRRQRPALVRRRARGRQAEPRPGGRAQPGRPGARADRLRLGHGPGRSGCGAGRERAQGGCRLCVRRGPGGARRRVLEPGRHPGALGRGRGRLADHLLSLAGAGADPAPDRRDPASRPAGARLRAGRLERRAWPAPVCPAASSAMCSRSTTPASPTRSSCSARRRSSRRSSGASFSASRSGARPGSRWAWHSPASA